MEDNLLIKTLKGQRSERVPFWFMRQAGRYLPEYREVRSHLGGFWDLVFNPEMAAKVTLQPIERFDLDAAILFSDILVIPHALGQKVSFATKGGPVLESLNNNRDDLGLSSASFEKSLSPIFETLRQVKTRLPKNKALIGFAGAPWTVATYMIEGKGPDDKPKTRAFAKNNPAKFKHLIDTLVSSTIFYLEKQIEAGADTLQIFDSWAGALQGDDFQSYCIEPTREIVQALKEKYPGVPIIGFPKGAGTKTKTYFVETGIDAISIDWEIDIEWAAEHLQPLGCVQGNLDPHLLVTGGEAMLRQAERILRTFSKGPHVFNLGHGITPDVLPENVLELSNFLKQWRA